MKITNVRCVLRETVVDADIKHLHEERLARPTDVYETFRNQEPEIQRRDGPIGEIRPSGDTDTSRVYWRGDDLVARRIFVEVDTNEGITGLGPPVSPLWAYTVLEMGELVVGQDPLATEKIADLFYGYYDSAHTGMRSRAVSAIDIALWDIRGKYYDAPVYELLGGPTRRELPTYASMLGYSVAPEEIRERAAEFKELGYVAQKWFLRHGPGAGQDGKQANLATVAAAREAVSDDYDLMFDCWRSWGLSYTKELLSDLAPYNPRWLEQPLIDQDYESYAELSAKAPFPIAGGEHDYTRWAYKKILKKNALDILQPDPSYTGGISEVWKIIAMTSAHDLPLMLHGHYVPANVHVIAATSPRTCPLVEYLVQSNVIYQCFYSDPIEPDDGMIQVPDRPGLGVSIDESAVEAEREIEFF